MIRHRRREVCRAENGHAFLDHDLIGARELAVAAALRCEIDEITEPGAMALTISAVTVLAPSSPAQLPW